MVFDISNKTKGVTGIRIVMHEKDAILRMEIHLHNGHNENKNGRIDLVADLVEADIYKVSKVPRIDLSDVQKGLPDGDYYVRKNNEETEKNVVENEKIGFVEKVFIKNVNGLRQVLLFN